MRFPTRARVVVLTLVPCYAMIALLMGFFIVRYKEQVETNVIDKGMLLGERLAAQITILPKSELASLLEGTRKDCPWISHFTLIDIYGQVVASDGSAKGLQWVLAVDGGTRAEIPRIQGPLFLKEPFEIYRPAFVEGKKHILRVGLDRKFVHRAVLTTIFWFTPGWIVALLISLLSALLLSRLSQTRAVGGVANMINRVADGHTHDKFELARIESGFSPLRDSLARLFGAFAENRERLSGLQRTVDQLETQAERERHDLGEALLEKESALKILRQEVEVLRERGRWAVLQLGEDGKILDTNHAARSWLSLGPKPDSRDLPAALIELVAEARRSETSEFGHGKIKVRHPLLGRERNLSVNSFPLAGIDSTEEKRILVILEDLEGVKGVHSAPELSVGRYLGLLRGGLIAFGRDIHERSAGWRDREGGESLLAALGMIVRDLDALATLEKIRSTIGTPSQERKSEVVLRRVLQRAEEISGIESVFEGKASEGENHEAERIVFRGEREDLEILLTVALEVVGICDPDPSVRVRCERLPDRAVFVLSTLVKGRNITSHTKRGGSGYRAKFLPVRSELLHLLASRLRGGMEWDAESMTLRLEIPCTRRITGESSGVLPPYAESFFKNSRS